MIPLALLQILKTDLLDDDDDNHNTHNTFIYTF